MNDIRMMNRLRLARAICSLGCAIPVILLGQQTAPVHRIGTPGEYLGLYSTLTVGVGVVADTADGVPRLVSDTGAKTVLKRRLTRWIDETTSMPSVTGLQLDAAGQLYAVAGQNDKARHAFDTRLATPSLSLADKAYTLFTAIAAFADGDDSTRMGIALDYLKRLDALDVSQRPTKFKGYVQIALAYEDAGRGMLGLPYLLHAFPMLSAMTFEERSELKYTPDQIDARLAFVKLAEIVGGDPSKRHVIDSIGAYILPLMKAGPELLARDKGMQYPMYAQMSQFMTERFQSEIQLQANVGRQAPPSIATHWYNAPAPSTPSDAAPQAHQLDKKEGIIRVLELGGLGCEGCLHMLPKMERLRTQFPQGVEFWYLSDSRQRWGATESTPDESAEHIRKYYVVRHHVTLPMGVWAPPVDDSVSDPGVLVARAHPTFQAYGIVGIPVFVVIDGHGIVRRMLYGGSQTERIIATVVTHLLAESRQGAASAAPPAPTAPAVTPPSVSPAAVH